MQNTSKAIAHPNIALIKYWGKKHEELIIPSTSSLSLTLEAYKTETSVKINEKLDVDSVYLNGIKATGEELKRITAFLDIVRNLSSSPFRAEVVSDNNFPTAAGLASSASGFAALALAAADAYGLHLSKKELSRLARRGSGSASRSIFGGFAHWQRGEDDSTSFAKEVDWQGPEVEMIISVIAAEKKAVSSRVAMQKTQQTSPYFKIWESDNEKLVAKALTAVASGDFDDLGKLTELSTMRMHALMMTSSPAIRYLTPKSFAVLDTVSRIREAGLKVYATADAGPNIKMFCTKVDASDILAKLEEEHRDITFVHSGIGGGARLIRS